MVKDKEREKEKGSQTVREREGVSDVPLAKCCGSRHKHSKSPLLFPSLSCLGFVSSHYYDA